MIDIFDKHPRPWTRTEFGARDTNERPTFDSPSFSYEELVPAIIAVVNAEPGLRAERDALRARVALLEGALRGVRISHDEYCDFMCDDDECDTTACTCGREKMMANIDAALAGAKEGEDT